MNKKINILFLIFAQFFIFEQITSKHRKHLLRTNHQNQEALNFNEIQANPDEIQQEWVKYKQQYRKKYKSQDEGIKYKKFSDNYNFIKAKNSELKAKNSDLQLAVNQFADMDSNEFDAYAKGTVEQDLEEVDNNTNAAILSEINSEQDPYWNNANTALNTITSTTDSATSASIDWVAKGYVNPVKNQGYCGSCWAFTATIALESLYKIKNPTTALPLYSQQQLLDCTYYKTSTWGMLGCQGGSYTTAFKYFANQSIATAQSYSYKAAVGSCIYKAATMGVWKNTYYSIVYRNNSQTLSNALQIQPVAVSLYASTKTFQFYSSGVYTESGCGLINGVQKVNHGVVITGQSVSSTGQNYWIVQNTWGSSWGNQGYVWIGFNADSSTTTNTNPGTCGIHLYPAVPT